MSKTYKNIYIKTHHFTKSMNDYELRISKYIYKKISLQYYKTVTCNISVSKSSGCTMPVGPEVPDVPVDIARKLSTTLFENPTWHTDVDKQYTSAILRSISQTQ